MAVLRVEIVCIYFSTFVLPLLFSSFQIKKSYFSLLFFMSLKSARMRNQSHKTRFSYCLFCLFCACKSIHHTLLCTPLAAAFSHNIVPVFCAFSWSFSQKSYHRDLCFIFSFTHQLYFFLFENISFISISVFWFVPICFILPFLNLFPSFYSDQLLLKKKRFTFFWHSESWQLVICFFLFFKRLQKRLCERNFLNS